MARMTNDQKVLSIYLEEISKIPLLSREEERETALKARSGDKKAKEALARANLRFVVSVAKKYQNNGIDLADLINEGNIGLLAAIDKFDADKGWRFISYAVWWIRQAILKAICEKSRAIRLPMNRANDLVRLQKARKIAGPRPSEEEEIAEAAKLLGMDEAQARELIDISREMVSIDSALSGRADEEPLEAMARSASGAPEAVAVDDAMRRDIDRTLRESLNPKEAKIIRMRFGLGGGRPMSLREVGAECRLTKERIRQIEKRALSSLRASSRVRALESYCVA